ncbi:MAG: hypothetical protein GX130_03465 [Candidatus Hydrogenedens sp.]|nr:hypothetical protein [Candidatus Hydrogenedens sp.]
MRYLKIIAVVYVVGLHIFVIQSTYHSCTVPSFYYNFYYKNETSYDFLLIKIVQLTDVAWGPEVLPNSYNKLEKNKIGHIEIPGEIDSVNTLFIVIAVPCTEKGEIIETKSEKVFIDIVTFASIRNNTFFSYDGSPPRQDIKSITDNLFTPVENIIKRFEVPL